MFRSAHLATASDKRIPAHPPLNSELAAENRRCEDITWNDNREIRARVQIRIEIDIQIRVESADLNLARGSEHGCQ
jgi:hypothetical protein